LEYDTKSAGAQSYRALARELTARNPESIGEEARAGGEKAQ
jgi:hypothetical protein